jgi:tol-pal system protein YbgF
VSTRFTPLIGTLPGAALAVLVLCGSGCLMTKSAGDELRAETNGRIQQLEADSRRSKEEIDAKLRELQQVLDQATAVLKRGSADVGAQVEQMREQVARLEGESAELRHKLELLDQQFMAQRTQLDEQFAKMKPGAKEAIDPAQIPADKAGHYKAAYDAYQAADYDKARGLWREYLTRYPADTKAGDAQYWIGATYTQQNKPATALGEYRKVIAEYPKSNAVNVALYGMADAFYRLHACTDAKTALQALIKRKPEAALADRAKKLLRDLEKPPKGFCTS